MTAVPEGTLFGMGNPLLDIVADADAEFLEKYSLKPNNAILAESIHQPMYQETVEKYKVQFIAGGSVQNTLRVAQWVLGTPNVATYMGAIGDDEFGKILSREASSEGVNVQYQVVPGQPTGTCAVLITGNDRSLCANLAAANHFTKDHLDKPESRALMEKAKFYYISGFFLTVSPESILTVAQYAASQNRPYMMNLSAPFILEFFSDRFNSVLPYIDILFGNETEARAFSKLQGFGTDDITEIALKTVSLPKENAQRPRVVVFTQGSDPVIVAELDGSCGKVSQYPVATLESSQIKDTNGAGDAFVGGFLAQYIQGQAIAKCIECGIWAATEVIQLSGATFPKDKRFPG
jgi:adenosine kinase